MSGLIRLGVPPPKNTVLSKRGDIFCAASSRHFK